MDAESTAARVATVHAWPASRRESANLALLSAAPLFDLELASACNIVCTFCPRDEMARPKTLMSEATFAAFEAFIPPGAVVMISGLGDALLHPRLPDYVARLASRGSPPCLITNGIRLTPELQVSLIAAGIAEIQVSVHALDTMTLAPIVSRGADPARVRANLETLATRGGVRVRVNFVETPDNRHARDAVRAFAEGLGFRFFYRRIHTRGGTVGAAPTAACSGCGIFGAVTFVTVDGDVMPCVNDVRGEGNAGNVRTLAWSDVLAWKRRTITEGCWFTACGPCDDDYRWSLLDTGLEGG